MAKLTLTEANGPQIVSKIKKALGTNPRIKFTWTSGRYPFTTPNTRNDKIKGIIFQNGEILITLEHKSERHTIVLGEEFTLDTRNKKLVIDYGDTTFQA